MNTANSDTANSDTANPDTANPDTANPDTANSEISSSGQRSERSHEYAIYKPNGKGTGGVIRFGLNLAKAAVFLDAASQSGERQFDWGNKFTMKWGLADIGSVLSVLRGHAPQARLFHKTDYANSTFELVRRDDPDLAPLMMCISRQEAADKSLRKVSIPITHADGAVLETVLEAAVVRLIGW